MCLALSQSVSSAVYLLDTHFARLAGPLHPRKKEKAIYKIKTKTRKEDGLVNKPGGVSQRERV